MGLENNDNQKRGFLMEDYIANSLREGGLEVLQHRTWGIDLVIKEPFRKRIKIEVKSAKHIVKNGKDRYRKGSFYFYPNNLERIDYCALIIDRSPNLTTYWVRGKDLREHFKNHKKESKIRLGIPTLLTKVPKIDFSTILSEAIK